MWAWNVGRVIGILFGLAVAIGLAASGVGIVMFIGSQWKPNHVSSLVRQGHEAYEHGDFYEALAFFEQAAQQAPDNPVAHIWYAKTNLDLGKGKHALRAANEGLRHHPHHYSLLDKKGDALSVLGRVEEAAVAYESCVAQQPLGYWEPWLKLGKTYEALGAKTKARNTYEGLLRLNPNSKEARISLASLDEAGTPGR